MSRQFWEETLSWATASGTAIASSTTETILFPNVTIPANYLQDGRVLRLRAFGAYGTTATPTLISRSSMGRCVAGTVIAKSTTMVTTSGVGGGASMTAMWCLEILIQTRSNGSSGTLMSNGSNSLQHLLRGHRRYGHELWCMPCSLSLLVRPAARLLSSRLLTSRLTRHSHSPLSGDSTTLPNSIPRSQPHHRSN